MVHPNDSAVILVGFVIELDRFARDRASRGITIVFVYVASGSAGSPSRGGDVAVCVLDINQPSLPTPFYSLLVSGFDCMALSTVFHSANFPDNSPLSHSVLLVLFLPCWSFQLYISL